MNVVEFVFLVLGAVCLIHYILESIIIYKYKELYDLTGLRIEFEIRRYLEILIIIITVAIFTYKFIS